MARGLGFSRAGYLFAGALSWVVPVGNRRFSRRDERRQRTRGRSPSSVWAGLLWLMSVEGRLAVEVDHSWKRRLIARLTILIPQTARPPLAAGW